MLEVAGVAAQAVEVVVILYPVLVIRVENVAFQATQSMTVNQAHCIKLNVAVEFHAIFS